MQLDWFTTVAQIVNFVVLLLLLRRFLYGPIVKAMDKREQTIHDRLQEAEEKRSKADEEENQFHEARRQLEKEHDERISKMRDEVEEKRRNLLKEAQEYINEQKQKWQHSLEQEQQSFVKQMRKQVAQDTLQLARRTLHDLADADIELRMMDKFISKIGELEPEKKTEISDSLQESGNDLSIRSAFDLPQKSRDKIASAVQKEFSDGHDLKIDFETESSLISGIEMQVGGHKVAWVIRDYLDSLEEQFRQKIDVEAGS